MSDEGTAFWRANISGYAQDLEELEAIRRIVNGLCVVFGATGIFVTDRGGQTLPSE